MSVQPRYTLSPTEEDSSQEQSFNQSDTNCSEKPEAQRANKDSLKQIKNAALNYLARRDYSRLELYQKLVAKGFQSSDIKSVLEYLQSQSYQSDERFADMYIRSRVNAGDGPFKIKISLRAKGICDSLALAVFDKLNIDWFEHAKALKNKRFGESLCEDLNEIAKQARYLKNKGFYQDHISSVINCSNHPCSNNP